MEDTVLHASHDLEGIGGWLAFRIVQLIVLSPFVLVHSMVVSKKIPLNPWIMSSVVLNLFGVVTGVLLLMRKREAITVVGFELVLVATYAVSYAAWAGIKQGPHLATVMTTEGLAILTCLAWYLYFHESVRVRNTYGRNL